MTIPQFKFIVLPLVLIVMVGVDAPDLVAQQPDDIVIIANKSFPLDSISKEELKRIFLLEKTVVKGKKVIPINARINSPLRERFAQEFLSMSPVQEADYWEKQKISQGTRNPTELSNTLKAIFSLKTGISYCLRKDYNDAVAKIITVK